MTTATPFDWVDLFRLLLLGFVGGLGAAVLSALLAGKREQVQRRHAFIERQLREFYSPLLGLRAEIRMKSELRVKIDRVAHEEWQGLLDQVKAGGPEAYERLRRERGDEFIDRMIEYDNKQLVENLLPAYRAMAKMFRENMVLADEDTRTHFGALIEYVELWDRWLAKAVPAEVMKRVDKGEAALHPFYDHLQRRHDELRERLAQGKA